MGWAAWSSSCSRNAHDQNVLVRRAHSRINQTDQTNQIDQPSVSLVPLVSLSYPARCAPIVLDVRTIESPLCHNSFSADCVPALFTRVRDKTAVTPNETGARSGEPARRQACRNGVPEVAVEAFVNNAG